MKKYLIILLLIVALPAYANEQAKRVTVSTTNFNSNLSSADDTVQEALDTLDDVVGGGGGGGDSISVNSSAITDMNLIDGDIDFTANTATSPDQVTATVACSGCIDATDLGADSVSSSELNATGVEAELEAALDLQEIQGAVTDSQVPNTITIDSATSATTATTATTANAGDSATAFFSSGTIEHERGGLEADVNAYDGLIGITGGATFNQTGTNAQIIIFDGSGAPTSAALSGDVSMTNAGVVTVADNSVDGTDIAVGSDAQGDILYYDGTNWVRLAKGTAGQILEMNAGATAPEWDTDDTGAGGGDAITVNTSAATDPDFANGDIDWTLTGGNSITATVACSGCVDDTDLAADSVSASELNATGVEAELEGVLDLNEIQGQISDTQIADGAVDGGSGGEITDASVDANDLGVDSVSASELNATGVESELEGVLDVNEIQGQIADNQIADGAVDGGTGGEIADGSITAADISDGAYSYEITLLPQGATLDDNSAPALTVVESTGTGTPRRYVAEFDAATDEIAYWEFDLPSDYTGGNIILTISWYTNDTGAGETAYWEALISATSEGDTDSMAEDAAGSSVTANEDVNTTEANRLIQTVLTLNQLDSAAAGDHVTLRFNRDANNASDDLSSDARLLSIRVQIPRS